MVKLPLTLNSKELRPTASSPPAHGASNVVWETHKVDVKAPVLNSLCSSYLFEVAWTKRSDVTFLPALQKGGEAPSPRCTSSSAELQSVRSNRHTRWVSFMKQETGNFFSKCSFTKMPSYTSVFSSLRTCREPDIFSEGLFITSHCPELLFHTCSTQQEIVHARHVPTRRNSPFGFGEVWSLGRACGMDDVPEIIRTNALCIYSQSPEGERGNTKTESMVNIS